MTKYDVIVVGAGPAGIQAALTARKQGAKVLLLEKNERIGKKLLSTGNGRCNLTNAELSADCYYSDDKAKVAAVLSTYGRAELLQFMDDIGILTCQKNGYYYPYSMQASSVREALETACRLLNIQVYCGMEVREIRYINENHYTVHTKSEDFSASAVIYAMGGFAAPKLGSDGKGFELLKELGLAYEKCIPALVPLTASDSFCKKLAGIRAEGRITLRIDGEAVATDMGEVQLTEYGISGIPTFQLSRIANQALQEKKNVVISVDFLPELSERELIEILMRRRADFTSPLYGSGSFGDLANGLVNNKLASTIASLCKIDFSEMAPVVSKEKYIAFGEKLKNLEFHITGSKGFEQAQTTAGGVYLKDLTPQMEVAKIPGLFVVGEAVNVDGICGGYNLQWAFSSGYVAGFEAARTERTSDASHS